LAARHSDYLEDVQNKSCLVRHRLIKCEIEQRRKGKFYEDGGGKMSKLDTANDLFDIAYFIGKALHGIATGREFTDQDAKDAMDAVSGAAKIGSRNFAKNEAENEEIRKFFELITETGKGSIDYIRSNEER